MASPFRNIMKQPNSKGTWEWEDGRGGMEKGEGGDGEGEGGRGRGRWEVGMEKDEGGRWEGGMEIGGGGRGRGWWEGGDGKRDNKKRGVETGSKRLRWKLYLEWK
jgi:hypothetical protein